MRNTYVNIFPTPLTVRNPTMAKNSCASHLSRGGDGTPCAFIFGCTSPGHETPSSIPLRKKELGLRFKPLKFGAPQANTQRCLVLR